MGRKPDRLNPDQVDSVLGKGTRLEGTVMSQGSLRVDGHLEGEVIGGGDVFIGQDATVVARIKARNVVVAGHVRGNIEAEGKLEIEATGVVEGDIEVTHLIVVEGGRLEGRSAFRRPAAEQKQGSEGADVPGSS